MPATVFGYSLGGAQEPDSVTAVLDAVGLSYLAEWSLRLEDGRWITVRLNEAGPYRLVVSNADYGYEGDIGERFLLDVPVNDRLVKQSVAWRWDVRLMHLAVLVLLLSAAAHLAR